MFYTFLNFPEWLTWLDQLLPNTPSSTRGCEASQHLPQSLWTSNPAQNLSIKGHSQDFSSVQYAHAACGLRASSCSGQRCCRNRYIHTETLEDDTKAITTKNIKSCWNQESPDERECGRFTPWKHPNLSVMAPCLVLPSCGRKTHISYQLEVAEKFWFGFSPLYMKTFKVMKPCHLYFFFPSSTSFIRRLGRKSSLFFIQEKPNHFINIEFK